MENEIKQLKATIDNLHQEHFKETTNLIAKHAEEILELVTSLTRKHTEEIEKKMEVMRSGMESDHNAAIRYLTDRFTVMLLENTAPHY